MPMTVAMPFVVISKDPDFGGRLREILGKVLTPFPLIP